VLVIQDVMLWQPRRSHVEFKSVIYLLTKQTTVELCYHVT